MHSQNRRQRIENLVLSDRLNSEAYADVVLSDLELNTSEQRLASLDVIIEVVRGMVDAAAFDADSAAAVQRLKMLLPVLPGDFFEYRRDALRDMLSEQLTRLLIDQQIDDQEALLQVELQRAFDLGYDQYMDLIKRPVVALIDRLIAKISEDSVVSEQEARALSRQLMSLDLAYKLSPQQRERLRLCGWALN